MKFAVQVDDLRKVYRLKGETVHALRGVSFDVPEGDYVAIMGTSGSGKSTLLNLLGCLDRPSQGKILLGGYDTGSLSDDELSQMRAARVGIIFQAYNLIQQLTVLENIEVPLYYRGKVTPEDRRRCKELALMVGLKGRLDHRPMQLSGGQQQRVAVARSLINNPDYILADEPTGNLDSRTTEEILALFERLNNEGRTIIIVTHEDDVSEHARRVMRMSDGEIASDYQIENRRSALATAAS
ncbi:ABC transporter ATP-binding protein [Blastopirellula marina]|uniref:ABC transporter n=1 Tax=Blastopirellula marina TaxID=124 RepID=A0A2S8FF71_9BACT|nr:ABC transporter ATP-binding protein [Blastopirellula marina]PQO30823.1 ABC transporter [Blastopirellula marina]PTL42676.1 ABC transporter ATP-binding protein [Blastopirellula marina]